MIDIRLPINQRGETNLMIEIMEVLFMSVKPNLKLLYSTPNKENARMVREYITARAMNLEMNKAK